EDPGPADPDPAPDARVEPATPAREHPLQARARARGQGSATSDPAPATGPAPEASTTPPREPDPAPTDPAPTDPAPTEPAAEAAPTEAVTAAPPAGPEAAAGPAVEPEPVVDAPDAPPSTTPEAAATGDQRELLERHWEGVLELVKNRSRRIHAVFLQAEVAGVSRNIVTLRYAKRYASFHAQNAVKGEFADVLRDAIERATGLRLKVDVVVEGDDDRRRPQPPSVTPDDARTPVLDDAVEEADVREAEASAPAPAETARTDELLAQELGAQLLEERPAPDAP
ncbi:MAG TPA: hypothetical protein VK906_04660, partial [Egicoccus sp.]|nr:hypothetical protein [Egicoccus sp.]